MGQLIAPAGGSGRAFRPVTSARAPGFPSLVWNVRHSWGSPSAPALSPGNQTRSAKDASDGRSSLLEVDGWGALTRQVAASESVTCVSAATGQVTGRGAGVGPALQAVSASAATHIQTTSGRLTFVRPADGCRGSTENRHSHTAFRGTATASGAASRMPAGNHATTLAVAVWNPVARGRPSRRWAVSHDPAQRVRNAAQRSSQSSTHRNSPSQRQDCHVTPVDTACFRQLECGRGGDRTSAHAAIGAVLCEGRGSWRRARRRCATSQHLGASWRSALGPVLASVWWATLVGCGGSIAGHKALVQVKQRKERGANCARVALVMSYAVVGYMVFSALRRV